LKPHITQKSYLRVTDDGFAKPTGVAKVIVEAIYGEQSNCLISQKCPQSMPSTLSTNQMGLRMDSLNPSMLDSLNTNHSP
jgi:hypothetical protein